MGTVLVLAEIPYQSHSVTPTAEEIESLLLKPFYKKNQTTR